MENKKQYYVSMGILVLLFFIFGLVSWVNTILIPYFKLTCQLSVVESYLVTFAFNIAYLVMAIPSSFLLNRVGYKKGIMLGLWMMSLGALVFIPAAYLRAYGVFLSGLFMLGIGLAILQSAANPYISIIGPIDSAAKRLSIVGTGNKLAGILANLVFAAVVIRESDRVLMAQINAGAFSGEALEQALDTLIQGVVFPYAVLSLFLFLFGLLVRFSPLPDIDAGKVNASTTEKKDERTSILQYPPILLGALALFCHVGTQMIALATIINYAGTMGLGLDGPAKNFPSFTMSFTFMGYILGILLIPKYVTQKTMLGLCTLLGLILSFLVIFTHGEVTLMGMTTDVSIWFLVLMGLPNALIYAGIWPLAIRGLGRFTNLGASLLVMMLCGNAILPLIYGYFSDLYGMRQAYWVMVPCFAYLVFFATIGHKIDSWTLKKSVR